MKASLLFSIAVICAVGRAKDAFSALVQPQRRMAPTNTIASRPEWWAQYEPHFGKDIEPIMEGNYVLFNKVDAFRRRVIAVSQLRR